MKKLILDGAGRRSRFVSQPNPDKKPITIRDDELQGFARVRHFGGRGLPTWQCFPYFPHTYYKSFERRMTEYRGEKYFIKGDWQHENFDPFDRDRALLFHNPLFNEVGPRTEKLLREAGLWEENIPPKSNSDKHDAYLSTSYASFEQMLPDGWRIEMHHEVLNRLGIRGTITVDGVHGCPDYLIILHTPVRSILLAFEIDCGTEQLKKTAKSNENSRRTWEGKSDFYLKLASLAPNGKRHYQNIFKLRPEDAYRSNGQENKLGFLVCVLTVGDTTLQNMLKVASDKYGKPCPFFIGQAHPNFAKKMRVPLDNFPFYTTPWLRHGHPSYYFMNPDYTKGSPYH